MLHARETRSKTRTVFHFNFPRGRNLVFEKLFHNASRLLPHRMCRQSIAFVSFPLRTRIPKLSERRCIPRSRILLLFVAFIHPSIHPSTPSFLPLSPPHRIHLADPSPSFTPAPNREIFPYSRGIHRQLYESWKEINFRRFERVFQGDYYHPDAGTLGKFCVSGRIYRGSHLGAIKS